MVGVVRRRAPKPRDDCVGDERRRQRRKEQEVAEPLAAKDDWHVCVYAETPVLGLKHARRRSKEQAGMIKTLLRHQCMAPVARYPLPRDSYVARLRT